ncbi:hypothetical protein JX266_007064 [Neoarthrinium moseri]|nr:hypothetical protein JX266_007064 [Neoarthrinium moseri]
MRFGCDFQRLQVPQWTDAYIDYDGLKQLVKTHHPCRDLDSFSKSFKQEIENINAFLQKQLSLIDRWVEATFSRFSLAAAVALEIHDLAQVALVELRDLANCLQEILAFITQLDEFAEVNQDAVQKLLGKIGPRGAREPLIEFAKGPLNTKPWVETAAHLRGLTRLTARAEQLHDDESEVRSLLLERVSPQALGCTSDEVHSSISIDDSAALMVVMTSPVSYLENQAMLYSVLQVAILHSSPMCLTSLLEEITAPVEDVGCVHRDALHQLIIRSSRPQLCLSDLKILEDTIRELSPYQHHMLIVKDWRNRYPLHYAAQYGLGKLCSQITKFMEPAAVFKEDSCGLTPLHLAVSSGHVSVVEALLRPDAVRSMVREEMAGILLLTAIQSSFADTVKCLLTLGKGINHRGKHGETPLYLAASSGQAEMVEALLAVSVGLDLNRPEVTRGWSPLIVACVRNHLEIVELLLRAGADTLIQDFGGWSAIEHACYRAHTTIVDALQRASPTPELSRGSNVAARLPQPQRPAKSHPPTCVSADAAQVYTEPQYTSVFVNLGSFDVYADKEALEVEPGILRTLSKSMEHDTILEVSGSPCQQEPYTVRLPLEGAPTEVTWVFSTTQPETMKLTFKLYKRGNSEKPSKRLIATGVALLDSIKGWFRPERQSLRRDSRVALITSDGDAAGTITFTFLLCSPYNARAPPRPTQTMRLSDSTQVVGHRGLGWNMPGLRRMQIGEHTIQFTGPRSRSHRDVQITRDRVPVIYHDWHVSETGLDIPIHAMTLQQWMSISETQINHHEFTRGRLPWDERARPSAPSRRNSRSLCAVPDHPRKALADRMKHTVEYARNHNKGNIRGECIHDAFVTLRQLFEKFPDDVSFDIEMKYPMFWECDYWEMEPYWIEMNAYIDATLDVVFELAGDRSIFFTCFNPEVCVLLSTKQKTYPVVFLNDSMISGAAGDKRATSLQEAMRFVRQWDLQGIVMAAEPFVAAPKLIQHVRNRGLVCGSYGVLNDVPEFAKKQAAEGIDMLIVNNIRLISNALRSLES